MVLFLLTIDEKNQRSMTPRMTAIFVKVAPFQRMGRISACFALLVKKPSSMHRTTIGHFARIVWQVHFNLDHGAITVRSVHRVITRMRMDLPTACPVFLECTRMCPAATRANIARLERSKTVQAINRALCARPESAKKMRFSAWPVSQVGTLQGRVPLNALSAHADTIKTPPKRHSAFQSERGRSSRMDSLRW